MSYCEKVEEWSRSTECELAFIEIKELLSSAETLAYYDPRKPLIVTCEASPYGASVGGLLS